MNKGKNPIGGEGKRKQKEGFSYMAIEFIHPGQICPPPVDDN
jgi:hypothetical protein